MSVVSTMRAAVRGTALGLAAGALALGLLVVFHPFDAVSPAGNATAIAALEAQIRLARDDLAQTTAALADVNAAPGLPIATTEPGLAQQLAAARDRADLARRHAKAIRDALAANADVSALAGIRDSVIVGQLLAQRAALEAQIVEQGARLGPSHPTMRALKAQLQALLGQVAAQTAAIADALDAEAGIEDTEIARLAALEAPSAPAPATPGVDVAALQQKAATQQAELTRLMDAYFAEKAGAPGAKADPLASLANPLNLLLAGLAAAAAIVVQLAIALEHRRARRQAKVDLDAWVADQDTIADLTTPIVPLPETQLRRAS